MAKRKTITRREPLNDVMWLSEVREVRHPIDQIHPLFVRHHDIRSGPPLPQPTVPYPEKHPYCEISFNFQGRITQMIGSEKIQRNAGDMMLLSPGTPHYALRLSYPQRSATIHFLPLLLFEMGPERDGARMLARFTAPQKISERVMRLPEKPRRKISARFEQMIVEFENREIGSELRLRALLMDTLVDILRWEESSKRGFSIKPAALNWTHIEKTLRYMHERCAEPLYIGQIANAVGLSVSRLQATFREALGMSCVHYLRALRISNAKALLCAPDARVTEVALAVGFETLSHFNTSFRSLIGMSPTEYIRSCRLKRN